MVALFIDLFGTDAFDVAIEFGVAPYAFFPSTAMGLSLFLHLPKLDQMVSCEYRDLPEPVQIPGCIPVRGIDLLDPVQDRKKDAYKWVLHNAKRYMMAKGIVVNSFKELEGGALEALLKEEPGKPRVYPVGPLIQTSSSSDVERSDCLKWLDGQPCDSVLYISFGSGGTLSSAQLNELAMGLELSEQRFIWVVRSPNDQPNATYFDSHGHKDPLGFLPERFLERTKDTGFVVPSWAPQAQI
nr:hydroquinone glucosyltransferase-like [Tanacetum cinerariifolium]GFC81495.1 hydroquinone glucosyltransferase-like [Tanacetum cinerariifolium]